MTFERKPGESLWDYAGRAQEHNTTGFINFIESVEHLFDGEEPAIKENNQ